MQGWPQARIACKFAGLKKTDGCSGEKVEDGPEFLKSGGAAIIDTVPGKTMCVESTSDDAPLGEETDSCCGSSSKQWTRTAAGPGEGTESAQKAQQAK